MKTLDMNVYETCETRNDKMSPYRSGHFKEYLICTCAFAKKLEEGWNASGGGFCDNLDKIIERVNKETGLPCVKGTAHLPKDYNLTI